MEKLLLQRQMLLVWLTVCPEEKTEKIEKQIEKIDYLLEDYCKHKTINFKN